MTALGALWPVGMLLALALLGRGRSRTSLTLLAVALLPMAAMFALGLQKRFLFDLRYFIGVVPLFVLLTARAVAHWPRNRVMTGVLATLVSLTLVAGLADQQLNGSNPRRYDFKPALARVAASSSAGDDLVVAPPYVRDLANYYQPQLSVVTEKATADATLAPTQQDPAVFVLGSFFDVGSERQRIGAILARLRHQRRLVATWRFANVRVWEFR
jgi:hypothetical protein